MIFIIVCTFKFSDFCEAMEKRLSEFIEKNHVFTLATVDACTPYCSTMFYVYLQEEQLIVFKSEPTTKHIMQAMKNSKVAGTVNSKNISIAKLQGIQFTGSFCELEGHLYDKAAKKYLSRFPIAGLITKAHFYGISPDSIKMTDNTLGFGKKIIWNREEEVLSDSK